MTATNSVSSGKACRQLEIAAQTVRLPSDVSGKFGLSADHRGFSPCNLLSTLFKGAYRQIIIGAISVSDKN